MKIKRKTLELVVQVRGVWYQVSLLPELKGFTIEVPALPGCFSQADTVVEANEMAREAIEGWLETKASARQQANAAKATLEATHRGDPGSIGDIGAAVSRAWRAESAAREAERTAAAGPCCKAREEVIALRAQLADVVTAREAQVRALSHAEQDAQILREVLADKDARLAAWREFWGAINGPGEDAAHARLVELGEVAP